MSALADGDRELALAFAPRAVREALRTLWRLDETLGRAVAAAREPMLGQIRLAFWRDHLGALEGRGVRDDPLLEALVPLGLAPATLVEIVDGWEELLAPVPLSDKAISAYASKRGGGMFQLSAAILGDVTLVREAGAGWAAVDLARHCSDADTARRAIAIGRERLDKAATPRAKALRVLTRLAAGDAARPPGAVRPRLALLRAVFG